MVVYSSGWGCRAIVCLRYILQLEACLVGNGRQNHKFNYGIRLSLLC